ncbi:MAG: hypothetical protein LW875_11545 [Proteobacteria bacterium]|jgi:hypothetical protein|nr:hypothetical protein [Pseudomonadota bacterium]
MDQQKKMEIKDDEIIPYLQVLQDLELLEGDLEIEDLVEVTELELDKDKGGDQ